MSALKRFLVVLPIAPWRPCRSWPRPARSSSRRSPRPTRPGTRRCSTWATPGTRTPRPRHADGLSGSGTRETKPRSSRRCARASKRCQAAFLDRGRPRGDRRGVQRFRHAVLLRVRRGGSGRREEAHAAARAAAPGQGLSSSQLGHRRLGPALLEEAAAHARRGEERQAVHDQGRRQVGAVVRSRTASIPSRCCPPTFRRSSSCRPG